MAPPSGRLKFRIASLPHAPDPESVLDRRFAVGLSEVVKVRADFEVGTDRPLHEAVEAVEPERDDLLELPFDDDVQLYTTARHFQEEFLPPGRAGTTTLIRFLRELAAALGFGQPRFQ